METLIFNGSPRRDGDTVSLIRSLQTCLGGRTTIINAYSCGVSPCVDCRYCWENPGCAIRDGWDEIDSLLRSCGSVVIASPVYFSELSGPLLSLLSRLQQYYCASAFRGEPHPLPPKRGGVLLVGGGDGNAGKAAETAVTLLRQMNCRETAPPVCCLRTNAIPALEEPGIINRITELARFLTGPQNKNLEVKEHEVDRIK